MLSKLISLKRTQDCHVHGAPVRAANRTLLLLVLAGFALIIWHVWVYGPAKQPASGMVERSFPLLLGSELWDLLLGGHGIIAELWDVFPYFIIGILIAGYIRTYKLAVRMQATLKRYGILSVFLASVVGMITPLCACGTLTTAISLLFARFPLAPVMALLVTSPLLSPSTYLLTLNDLGPEWTVIRTIAAFSMGMFAGTVTHLLRDRGFHTDAIFIEGAIPRGDFHDEAYPDERLRCDCKEKFGHRVAARTNNMFVIFLAKSSEMLWMVGKYVIAGVVIGAIVERYMPYDWIYGLFGRKSVLSIVWVTLGSVPIFLHQLSVSSILSHIKSMLHGTLDAGAALAFMIGGPVTAMPTMIMFWTIFKKKVFFLYMFICLAGTLLISYAFQFFVVVPYADMGNPLLKKVASLSGGESLIITKTDENVRIVLDPGGKAIIATYTNDLEGRGGIVFDAGREKFLKGFVDRYDNQQYIENVASWLEESNTSSARADILIYDMHIAAGSDRRAFSSEAVMMLRNKGYTVSLTDRRETPAFTEDLLRNNSQLWVVMGESLHGGTLNPSELEVISRFHSEGKGMLILAGTDKDGPGGLSVVNQLSGGYGVHFSGIVHNDQKLHTSTASYFFSRAAEVIGRVLKIVHKA